MGGNNFLVISWAQQGSNADITSVVNYLVKCTDVQVA